MAIYVSIIMYCLLLFYKNYDVYDVVYMFISSEYLSLHQVSLLPDSEIAKCIA